MRVPGLDGAKLFFAPDRDGFIHQWREGARMQNFGSVISQFGGFAEAYLGKDFGIGNQARIGGHDAIYIGPDPKLGGADGGGDDGGGEVGTAAPERGGTAVDGGSVESGKHRSRAGGEQWIEPAMGALGGRLHHGRSVSENPHP